jgi:outer membrane protein assembly factor BamB
MLNSRLLSRVLLCCVAAAPRARASCPWQTISFEEHWAVDCKDTSRYNPRSISGSPAGKSTLYTTFGSDKVAAISAADGTVLWSKQPGAEGALVTQIRTGVKASPDGTKLFVGGYTHFFNSAAKKNYQGAKIYAMNAADGSHLWEYALGSTTPDANQYVVEEENGQRVLRLTACTTPLPPILPRPPTLAITW